MAFQQPTGGILFCENSFVNNSSSFTQVQTTGSVSKLQCAGSLSLQTLTTGATGTFQTDVTGRMYTIDSFGCSGLNIGPHVQPTGAQGAQELYATGGASGDAYLVARQMYPTATSQAFTGPEFQIGPGISSYWPGVRYVATNGDNTRASVNGYPYATIDAAVSAATAGECIQILPGNYPVANTLNLPTGVALRGLSSKVCNLNQNQTSTGTGTLIVTNSQNRIEDLTLNLTGTSHLIGIQINGDANVTSSIRTCAVLVDNSSVLGTATANAQGILNNGTGDLGSANFDYNLMRALMVNVKSNGAGRKAALASINTGQVSLRDCNFQCADPLSTGSTGGSYQGQYATAGSFINNRTSAIQGPFPPSAYGYTGSDILVGLSSNIQIGPGVELVHKTTDGGLAPSFQATPVNSFFGVKGSISNAPNAFYQYLWPGTSPAQNSAGGITYPDSILAQFKISQDTLLAGMSLYCATGPGSGIGCTASVQYSLTAGVTGTLTPYQIYLTGSATSGSYSTTAFRMAKNSYQSVQITGTNNQFGTLHDLGLDLNFF